MRSRHNPSTGSPSAPPKPTAGGELLVSKNRVLRSCMHAVAFASEVGPAPLSRRLLETDIVMWRGDNGSPRVAIDRCPHRWAKLSAGTLDENNHLTCPYHGWKFGSDGRAVDIPQLPVDTPIPPAACLQMLASTERFGLLWVCLESEPVNQLPHLPEFHDEMYRCIEVGTFDYDCSAAAVIDNNTDGAHVAFVHASTFGAGQDPRIPMSTAWRTGYGIAIESFDVPVANRPSEAAATTRTSLTEIWLPFVQISRMRYPDGQMHLLFKGCCPIDDSHTAVHLSVLRNDVESPVDAEDIIRFESAVEREDAVVLRTLPAPFPLDLREQCHLRHDRGGIEYRRALAEFLTTPSHRSGIDDDGESLA